MKEIFAAGLLLGMFDTLGIEDENCAPGGSGDESPCRRDVSFECIYGGYDDSQSLDEERNCADW